MEGNGNKEKKKRGNNEVINEYFCETVCQGNSNRAV